MKIKPKSHISNPKLDTAKIHGLLIATIIVNEYPHSLMKWPFIGKSHNIVHVGKQVIFEI
jgi:hypothetical protein